MQHLCVLIHDRTFKTQTYKDAKKEVHFVQIPEAF